MSEFGYRQLTCCLVRNKRKQDRSCIKFTFSGFLVGEVKNFATWLAIGSAE